MDPVLSVAIVTWNTEELTIRCLEALRRDTPSKYSREIVVVDNASKDATTSRIRSEFPDVVLVENPDNYLYAKANNQAVQAAKGRYVCLLNSDTEVTPGALDRMVDFLETHTDYGAVSPRLLNFDGSIQKACSRFPGLVDPLVDSTLFRYLPMAKRRFGHTRMFDFDHSESRDIDQPPAACMMMHRAEYVSMGGMDENLSLFYNDVDLCLRISKAHRGIHYLADAVVYHHRGASVGQYNTRNQNVLWVKNRKTFYEKYYGVGGRVWLDMVYFTWVFEVAAGILLGRSSRGRVRTGLANLANHVQSVFEH
jgi:GT2 family glycosyltransferase